MSSKITRRGFVKSGAVATAAGIATALAAPRARGANERIRLGFIGVGNRGGQLIDRTTPNEDAEIVALCDVYQPYLDRWADKLGGGVAKYTDFRKMLERDDLDAVFVATPDHWHAIQTIDACDAGMDVYVEKPLSMTVHEGRRMVEAARRNNRVVQVGLQRRSSEHLAQLRELVQQDGIGKVTVGRCYRITNMYPDGIGIAPDSDPPADLDWDLWLGPRPMRPFNKNIAPYKFRWWKLYSSQIGNWGVHYFDIIRWIVGEKAPASISSHGGRFVVNDARTIPDTMETTFEFASGRLLLFGQYEGSGAPMFPWGEFELRGTLGMALAGGGGYRIRPETGGQFQDPAPRMEPVEVKPTSGDDAARHIRNFLDCVKSRNTPNADVEEGHLSTIFSHLGNIALATRMRIDWDPDAERVTNHKPANKLLHYKYREPWKLG